MDYPTLPIGVHWAPLGGSWYAGLYDPMKFELTSSTLRLDTRPSASKRETGLLRELQSKPSSVQLHRSSPRWRNPGSTTLVREGWVGHQSWVFFLCERIPLLSFIFFWGLYACSTPKGHGIMVYPNVDGSVSSCLKRKVPRYRGWTPTNVQLVFEAITNWHELSRCFFCQTSDQYYSGINTSSKPCSNTCARSCMEIRLNSQRALPLLIVLVSFVDIRPSPCRSAEKLGRRRPSGRAVVRTELRARTGRVWDSGLRVYGCLSG